MQIRFMVLAFSTPDWLRNEVRLVRVMRIFRLAQIVGLAAWLTGIYLGFVANR